jgi:hypothetical protein
MVGLGASMLCLAIAIPTIWGSKRLGQPWIGPRNSNGYTALVLLILAGCGVLIALFSALAAILG